MLKLSVETKKLIFDQLDSGFEGKTEKKTVEEVLFVIPTIQANSLMQLQIFTLCEHLIALTHVFANVKSFRLESYAD